MLGELAPTGSACAFSERSSRSASLPNWVLALRCRGVDAGLQRGRARRRAARRCCCLRPRRGVARQAGRATPQSLASDPTKAPRRRRDRDRGGQQREARRSRGAARGRGCGAAATISGGRNRGRLGAGVGDRLGAVELRRLDRGSSIGTGSGVVGSILMASAGGVRRCGLDLAGGFGRRSAVDSAGGRRRRRRPDPGRLCAWPWRGGLRFHGSPSVTMFGYQVVTGCFGRGARA